VGNPEGWKWSSYAGTGGVKKPHCCLTTDWVLGQFHARRMEAQRRYRQFVKEGIGERSIWGQLKGQSLLGRVGFVDRLSGYLRRQESIQEIPRVQRFVGHPELASLFTEKILLDKTRRNRAIATAVEAYGYSQKEVADYLGMHYATISRLVNKAN